MKKLLIALMLTVSSTAFAEIELDERDSRELYYALAKWGVREADKGDQVTRIHVRDVDCDYNLYNGGRNQEAECDLYDELHNDELERSGKTAWTLIRALKDITEPYCNTNRTQADCEIQLDEVRCWHKWDDKDHRNNNHHGREYFCKVRRNNPEL